jgi:hypothetical protein
MDGKHSQKYVVEFHYYLVLGPLFWEHPNTWGFTLQLPSIKQIVYANINTDAYLQKIIGIQSFFHGIYCSKPYSIIPWSIPNLCFPLLIHTTNLKIIK